MILDVQEMKTDSLTVLLMALECITVATVKMLESDAMVFIKNMYFALVAMLDYYCYPYTATAECNDNQIRLVNGTSSTNGRIEVCVSGRWGTVCDDQFDSFDATVACRHLGLGE